jgi:kynureninase
MPYHEFLTESTARVIGALPIEVVVMNSLTINLHLMMVSFYRPTRDRFKILIEAGAFPSDQYAVEAQLRFHGFDPATALIEVGRSGAAIPTEEFEQAIARDGKHIALVLVSGVNYYTGQAFEIDRITAAARAQGCAVGIDLAHAAGNLALRMHDSNADFAIWCSYKYLNGGPGSIGGCFVHERHARNAALPRFAGWWGHDKQTRFTMPHDFIGIPGAEGWQVSNPSILPMAALRASMEIFDEAGIANLRAKSIDLTGYLEFLIRSLNHPSIRIITPSDPAQRGAQLSLHIPHHGRELCDILKRNGFICDWREPSTMRLSPAPLYNSFSDVHRLVQKLGELAPA